MREFEENRLRQLKDQISELRKVEQSLIQVREIFVKLSTSVMKQVSHTFLSVLSKTEFFSFSFFKLSSMKNI